MRTNKLPRHTNTDSTHLSESNTNCDSMMPGGFWREYYEAGSKDATRLKRAR